MKIPEEYQQLCRDIAKVLRDFNHKHGCMNQEIKNEKTIYQFTGKISISERDMSDVSFTWECGRHGDSQGKIEITTHIRVNTKIDD